MGLAGEIVKHEAQSRTIARNVLGEQLVAIRPKARYGIYLLRKRAVPREVDKYSYFNGLRAQTPLRAFIEAKRIFAAVTNKLRGRLCDRGPTDSRHLHAARDCETRERRPASLARRHARRLPRSPGQARLRNMNSE